MPGPEHKSPEASLNHDRLNGWKEISNYLGKSVRTSQRWERILAMPIHRIHTARGEVVFGSRQELDRWQTAKGQESSVAPQALPEPVTLDWLASLPEPEFLRLLQSGKVSRGVWSELICKACLTLHKNTEGAATSACQRVLELLSSLPKSRHTEITKQARTVLARWKRADKE